MNYFKYKIDKNSIFINYEEFSWNFHKSILDSMIGISFTDFKENYQYLLTPLEIELLIEIYLYENVKSNKK